MKVLRVFKKTGYLPFLWSYFVWLEVPRFMKTFIVRAGSGALVLSLVQAVLAWLESDLDVAFAEMGRAFWVWIKILFLLFLALLYVPRVLTKLHYLKKRLNKEGGAWENILMNGARALHEEWESGSRGTSK